ncbi:ParA family protein, partial [Pseudomonas veronii]|uniref:ParA family protein n=1 Tax=Pseudomonas veronii TaxID=76761 RepID=UPI000FBC84A5
MKVAAVVSTKGGPGKTTVGVNLGAFCADAGIRTLLIDAHSTPSGHPAHQHPATYSTLIRPGS